MTAEMAISSYFELDGVRTRLGSREILRGISLEIPEGRTTVVLGGSGAGKSVLLKHLNGLIQPNQGSVKVKGEDLAEISRGRLQEIRRKIGLLFQDGALFDSLTVEENVAFPLEEEGTLSRTEVEERVRLVLESVGLDREGTKMPEVLSGGMRKRVGLARALATHPQCLLCDEPTAGLDPVLAETVCRLIRSLTEERQLTSVVVTHDLGAMRSMADRVVFLQGGSIRFSGSPDELGSCGDPAVQAFLESGEFGRG